MDSTQRDAIQRLLKRVDEVRGLESMPAGSEVKAGDETARLLATAEGLVEELEKARRRLIETNVQLVSLREVAHSMVSSVGTEETTQTVTTYLHKAFGFEDVFLALVNREEAVLEGTWTRRAGTSHASVPFKAALTGEPEGVLSRTVWQHRPFTIHDAQLHPPFESARHSTLSDVVEAGPAFIAVPLQKSRSLYLPHPESKARTGECPLGPEGLRSWDTPPPGKDGRG